MKCRIDMLEGKWVEVINDDYTFEQFCQELTKTKFYISLANNQSIMINTDKILVVVDTTNIQ